jgi:hypothetical protein
MRGIIHDIMDADPIAISVNPMFVQTSSNIDDMDSSDVNDIQA